MPANIHQKPRPFSSSRSISLSKQMAAPTSFALSVVQKASPKRVTYKKQKALALALALVNKEGANLRLLPPKFRNDRKIVLAAVSQNGNAIEHASDTLKSDRDIILAAVRQDLHALDFINLDSEDKLLVEIISLLDSNEKSLEAQTILTEALTKKRYKLAENLILCGAELSSENMESIKNLDPESQECQNIRAAIEELRDPM